MKDQTQNRTKPPMPLKKPVNLTTLDQVITSSLDSAEPQIKSPSIETGNNRLKSFYYKRKGQYEMTNASLATQANLSQHSYFSQGKSVFCNSPSQP